MPRGKRNVIANVNVNANDSKLTGLPSVESFNGWDKLQPTEQATLKAERDEILAMLKVEGQTRINLGEHLTKMRTILDPKRMFVSFLDHCFKMSRATAYRYMEEYRTAKQLLPAPVFELASIRHVPIREKVITENPPPDTTNVVEIEKYLDRISSIPTTTSTISAHPEVLLKECVNFCTTRYNRVTGHHKTKDAWVRRLIGMLQTRFGVTEPTTYTPMAIPENFEVNRGRPKQTAA